MKVKYALLLLIAALFQFSFIANNSSNVFEKHELNLGESTAFNDSIGGKIIQFSLRRGAFDLSRYKLEGNNEGLLKLFNLHGATGNHQNELEMKYCSGIIKRDADTISIQAISHFTKLYIFSIEKNGIVDSSTNRIQIKLIAKTLKNEYCPSLINTYNGLNLVALPDNIKEKEIYKPFHSNKTIGVFSYFAIYDEHGNVKNYPPNDYVIIGGNALSVGQ